MFAYLTSYFQSVWNSIFGPLLMLTSLRINNKHHPSSGRLLVLGLDNAGKTTLLQAIRRFDTSNHTYNHSSNHSSKNSNNNNLRSYPPTDRPEHIKNIVTINNQITFHAYDLGGHEAVRHLWSDYYHTSSSNSNDNDSNYHNNTDSTNENNLAILFCIDIADRQRIEEAAYELDALIHDGLHANQNQNNNADTNNNINNTIGNDPPPKYGIPIAILLTKCDDMHEANAITDTTAPLLMTLPEVCDLIDYTSLQQSHDGPMHICTISVYKNTGYIEALQWITKTLVQQQQQI